MVGFLLGKASSGVFALCHDMCLLPFVRRRSQSEQLKYPDNRFSWNHQILQEHSYRPHLQSHRIWRHWLILVGNYHVELSKCRPRRLLSKYFENGARIVKFDSIIGDNQQHKPARYGIANCIWSAAKCSWINQSNTIFSCDVSSLDVDTGGMWCHMAN